MSKLEGNEFSPVDLFLPEFSPACGRAHNEFSPACGRVHNEFSPKNKNMLFYIRYLYIFGIRRSMFMFGIVIFQYYVIFVSFYTFIFSTGPAFYSTTINPMFKFNDTYFFYCKIYAEFIPKLYRYKL
uniref:Uncharacterized protein n=1 Tax=Cacopsylla melanoneura TaxID=428564 RepID=A0A8D8S5C0_9HEMI